MHKAYSYCEMQIESSGDLLQAVGRVIEFERYLSTLQTSQMCPQSLYPYWWIRVIFIVLVVAFLAPLAHFSFPVFFRPAGKQDLDIYSKVRQILEHKIFSILVLICYFLFLFTITTMKFVLITSIKLSNYLIINLIVVTFL